MGPREESLFSSFICSCRVSGGATRARSTYATDRKGCFSGTTAVPQSDVANVVTWREGIPMGFRTGTGSGHNNRRTVQYARRGSGRSRAPVATMQRRMPLQSSMLSDRHFADALCVAAERIASCPVPTAIIPRLRSMPERSAQANDCREAQVA